MSSAGAATVTSVLSMLLLLLLPAAASGRRESMTFVEAVDMETLKVPRADYIVVGGGTAGCPIAATLSKSASVLVLERGGRGDYIPTVEHQEGFVANIASGSLVTSPAESFVSEDGVQNARGRVLGGGSSVNAGFYSRAHPQFFEDDEAAWDMALVNSSYCWIEQSVVFEPSLGPWQSAFTSAMVESGVFGPFHGFTLDHVDGTKIGGSIFDHSGLRHSAARFLSLAKSSNIRVVLHAHVTRILFTGSGVKGNPRAFGVEYMDMLGNLRRAVLRDGGEVIVTAGALGSPQLLILSGVGPREEVTSLGIPVMADVEGVGQEMADNPRSSLNLISRIPVEYSLIQAVGITRWYFVEASSAHIGGPLNASALGGGGVNIGTIVQKIAGPVSKGRLRVVSRDVRVPPSVRFNYFADPEDLRNCVDGMRTVAKILQTKAMKSIVIGLVGTPLPDDVNDDEAMGGFCRDTVSTLWHYHGGCVMGNVVGKDYRVRGVDSVRVIDGSTFKITPGTNPQATVMMLGRYMGIQILREKRDKQSRRLKRPNQVDL